MGSQAQNKEATEMDEAELASMPELDALQADQMVENSLFENAASGEFSRFERNSLLASIRKTLLIILNCYKLIPEHDFTTAV